MKLKKGSKEARDFMAKIRAKKKGTKKAVKKRAPKELIPDRGYKKIHLDIKPIKKINGTKHTDIKSHNYKVYISGISDLIKDRDIWEKMLKAKKWIIKQKENVLKMQDISKEYKKECASDIKLYKKQILTIKKEIRLLNSQISK